MATEQASGQKGPGVFPLAGDTKLFRVWAPEHPVVSLQVYGEAAQVMPMEPVGRGYHEVVVEECPYGTRYCYVLGAGKQRPDPASRSQPEGVHGPSELVNPEFDWRDSGWKNPPLEDYVLYELHVGTFTAEGTFDAVIPHLSDLKELGVTAIELMPVAQFPGERNWGYDGVAPYAVQSSYGGPEALKRLVNAAHETRLAVTLDVVYNHLGPEGNYLREFGPYFSQTYSTPWGDPVNFDGPYSDEVRRYFIENALYWTDEFHIDALRLDAIHAIYDFTAQPFLRELSDAVHERASGLGRTAHLIAESSLNDPRILWHGEDGGHGMDSHWNDDFHHALHVALTGERREYYVDFNGLRDLAEAMSGGYVYRGQYSEFRKRRHGAKPEGADASQLVVFSQNHDQVGNRAAGDRLSASLHFGQLKLAAGAVLLSPSVPLLFMGEEFGETAPFPYFVSHSDDDLVEAVRRGRAAEFSESVGEGVEVPDPQAEETFLAAKLDHSLKESGRHHLLRRFYQELLRIRREHPALQEPSFDRTSCIANDEAMMLVLDRWNGDEKLKAVFNFGVEPASVVIADKPSAWQLLLNSADEHWSEEGKDVAAAFAEDHSSVELPPHTFVVFEQRES